MGSARPEDTLAVPVSVCLNPTDLSADFPHGGTALGLLRPGDSHFQEGIGVFPVIGEEFAGHATMTVQSGDVATVSMFLRQWDADALSAGHIDTEAGSATGRRMAHLDVSTNEKRPGSTPTAGVLYLSPRASQHPGLLLFRVEPASFTSPVAFTTAKAFEVPMVWYCTPEDVSGDSRVWSVGMRADLHAKFGSWLSS